MRRRAPILEPSPRSPRAAARSTSAPPPRRRGRRPRSRPGTRSRDGSPPPRGLSGRDHPLAVEIALGGRARPDQARLVGAADVQRAAVGLGVDRDRADAELAQRAKDPDGDLAAIRDGAPCETAEPWPRSLVLEGRCAARETWPAASGGPGGRRPARSIPARSTGGEPFNRLVRSERTSSTTRATRTGWRALAPLEERFTASGPRPRITRSGPRNQGLARSPQTRVWPGDRGSGPVIACRARLIACQAR